MKNIHTLSALLCATCLCSAPAMAAKKVQSPSVEMGNGRWSIMDHMALSTRIAAAIMNIKAKPPSAMASKGNWSRNFKETPSLS